ncbi:MAG TPA: sialidase family protein, partial [Methylomirabilota bacterium]|nr:sialidase family protein [Methylomirabilota bacterium]
FGTRLRRGQKRWSKPAVIAHHPLASLGNPVVWQAPNGWVWLFFVVRPGDTWSTSRIAAKISKDGARTWSDAFPVTFEAGTMVRGHPIVLRNGDYLLPIYHETGSDPEFTAPDTTALFLRYEPATNRWSESARIRARLGALQPAVVELAENHLLAFCRRGGDYNPATNAFIVRSESRDNGRTWSPGEDTEFPNPNAAIELLRLRNGHLLLVYNDSMSERTPLRLAVSTDGGRTFPHRRNLAEGPGDFAYPVARQTRDGKIHVVFTSDERTVIRHAVLAEEAILRHQR